MEVVRGNFGDSSRLHNGSGTVYSLSNFPFNSIKASSCLRKKMGWIDGQVTGDWEKVVIGHIDMKA